MLFAKINSLSRQAFSLVEVVIALGVTSFAVLALIGTLPVGIKSVQDSSNESARANITQEIRAELQQVSFGTTASHSISGLSSQTNYYNNEGDILTSNANAYYMAVFALTNTAIPNSGTTTTYFQSGAAQTIQMTLSYPYNAPVANRTTSTNYLLAAKQKNY
jgi:uncharacterized protein (TIGR02598 family)